MPVDDRELSLRFHGRVIDHLGLEMYQSPVAAVAEIVSNAWDADAALVEIELPASLDDGSELLIRDNGVGMSFFECQRRFLNVGYNRRGSDPTTTSPGGRPLLGRKGIGKFAGFGIAQIVEVETISTERWQLEVTHGAEDAEVLRHYLQEVVIGDSTPDGVEVLDVAGTVVELVEIPAGEPSISYRPGGEKTVFQMDLASLRSGPDDYAGASEHPVSVVDYLPPDDARADDHGTTVRLRSLTVDRRPSPAVFGRSMARRFLLLERVEGFRVTVDGHQITSDEDSEAVEFDFPTDYRTEEMPGGLQIDEGWGVETLPTGEQIRWRLVFYEEPVPDEDLSGVAVFAHGKLAQRPFFFNLTGGLGGQTGMHYLSGRVEADFVDELDADLISTERQRINWERTETAALRAWGQERVQSLLRLWQARRAEEKIRLLEERLEPFSQRLGRLPRPERRVVERAMTSVARIQTLSNAQFAEFASAMLTAWEAGRLHDLIDQLAEADELDEAQLLVVLGEANVLTALHTAEKVRSQVELVEGLRRRVEGRELENAVRDYIAENPWLLGPEWETFVKERGVDHLVLGAADEAGLSDDDDWNGRVDLVLAAGETLLIVEFMRPGLAVDWDHVDRFNRYVNVLREKIAAAAGQFRRVRGLLVADRLERRTGMVGRIAQLRGDDMDVVDWPGLLARAEAQWREFLGLLRERAPDDERLAGLIDEASDEKSESE